jgi:hypothetical protein
MFSKVSRVESGWVPVELERIGFLGGAIAVHKIQYNPFEKGYISITVEAHISSEENLSAYIDSRTNALNMLLDSVSHDSIIQAAITFRTPIEPEEFLNLSEALLLKFSDYAVIVTESNGLKGIELFCHQTLGTELTENMTHIGEGKTVEGIIGVDAVMKAEAVRMLQSDSRVLLIDPYGDPVSNEVAEKYRSMGFSVEGPSPAYMAMWNQVAELRYRVAWFSYQNL